MSKREQTLLLIAVTLANFLGAFIVSATNIALPAIQAQFGLSAAGLSWIPLAYVLGTAAALMPMGRVGDMNGHKRTFTWALRAFTAVALATALAPSAEVLIGLRAVLGITSAAVITTSVALVTFAYPPEERGRRLGVFAAGPYLGMTLGPVLGGFVVQSAGWRGLFVAAGALSVLVCFMPVWNLSGIEWRASAKTRFDAAGAALYGVALPVMLLGFTLLPRRPGMVLSIMGAVGVFAFVLWETRAGDPLVDIHLFRSNRVLAGANVAAFANYAAVAAVTFLMSLYLQYTRGLDPQTAGIVLVGGAFVQAAFSPVAGRVADRVNARTVAAAGMGLTVLGLLGLSFIGEQTPYGYVIGMTCLLGLGFAFFASPITHAVMGSVGSTHVGMASSTLAAVRWTGNNVSIAIAGLILSAAVGPGAIGPAAYPRVLSAVRLSLYVFAGLCLVGLAALLVAQRDGAQPSDTKPALPR